MTFQDMYQKTQRLAKDNNSDVLTQLKQDINTGYHMFNQKLGRYYSRKQEFANLVASQAIYQQPIDSIRIMGMSALVTSQFEPPVKQIRNEYQWRQITSVKGISYNWPTYYFVLGKDQFQLWPTPSQSVTNGIRYWYQPLDHDLTLDDTTSASITVTVTNGSPTVTASSGIFTSNHVGQKFQVTGIANTYWYDIVAVPNGTTLTLKSAYIDASAGGQTWRIGQIGIIPQEYQDAPMHYALGNYFSANGNDNRAQFHLGTQDKPGMYYNMLTSCEQDYSSSSTSSVITDDDMHLNPWLIPPLPSP